MVADPRRVEAFDWDDDTTDDLDFGWGNVAELAAHKVMIHEAEEVVRDDVSARVLRNKNAAAGRWFVVGTTRNGRKLRLSVLWTDEARRILRVVTGWDEP